MVTIPINIPLLETESGTASCLAGTENWIDAQAGYDLTDERAIDQGVDESDVADYTGLHFYCCLLTTKNRIKDEHGFGAN